MRILGGVALLGLLLVGCNPKSPSGVTECVPAITPVVNSPGMQQYVSEFAERRKSEGTTNRGPPQDAHKNIAAVRGKIFIRETNPVAGSSLVVSYEGEHWNDQQRLYYFPSNHGYTEIVAFQGKALLSAVFLTNEVGAEIAILADVSEDVWKHSIWKLDLRSNQLARVTTGGWWMMSPDGKSILFRRSDGEGFHSFHLLNLSNDEMQDIISMWESDPGSGTSFDVAWSKDSKAVNFFGSCSGFYRRGQGRQTLFDLVYSISEKKMYSSALGQYPAQ